MNLTFRLCTAQDISLADGPFIAAYGFQESRKDLLHQYWALQPDGWWLALLDAKPVGFGGAVDYGPFCFIGMISVHPSVQRRGIGKALMERILAWGQERHCPTMLLDANEGAVSLYQRLGFVEEGIILKFLQFGKVTLPPLASDLHQILPSDISALVAFDAPFFGAERSKIFQSYLRESTVRGFLARDSEEAVTGYIFAEPGFLGPWVASTPEIAEHLLVQMLTQTNGYRYSTTLPEVNDEGLHLLKRYNFHPQGKEMYMRYGAPIDSRQLAMIYGEASSALG